MITDNDYNQALIKYLVKNTPKEWHQIAWNWNWDNGTEPLVWIIKQPLCNKGTALLIYWYAKPRWYCQYSNREQIPPHELKVYDLIKEIESKYVSGFYNNDHIYFDPKSDPDDGHDWTKEYEEMDLKQNIPDIMLKPSCGQKIEKKIITEGYPQEVCAEVEKTKAK